MGLRSSELQGARLCWSSADAGAAVHCHISNRHHPRLPMPAPSLLCVFVGCRPLERQLENLNCNATSAVAITHVLLERMRAKKLRGCFVYTSSAAAAIPNPFRSAPTSSGVRPELGRATLLV